MHTTHDLWDKRRYMGSTIHHIWWQSDQPFLSYSLSSHFYTLRVARATRQADPPNVSSLVAVDFYRMGLPDSENVASSINYQPG